MSAKSSELTKEDLQELLRPKLKAEGAEVEDISIRRLTKPGDNYGSTMLAVDVNLRPGPRTLHLVAKMIPKSSMLKEFFHCNVTVKKETYMYLLVCPEYERIQKENNVPDDKFLGVFPECYGARISSKGDSEIVDDGAVILQGNLKVQGYECGDRIIGLDLPHCELVVDKLARFHATGVAMKIKKPDKFKEIVLKSATPVAVGPGLTFVNALEAIPEYATMKERITTALVKSKEVFDSSNPKPPREPFATLTHLDLWVNNIMFQYESGSSKENPKKLKLVDFQLIRYDSPAKDLLFFLYSSAKLEVLSEHYDYLVRLYYDSFLDCLRILGCDTKPFIFEDFLDEMENASVSEFWHIAFMVVGISVPSEESHSTDDITHGDFQQVLKVGKTFYSRASKFVLDFASRNWI
ncbi:hypothetical protein PR048_026210 [Dryococelus australis]|uniref:CHK kinase-like domain-containing protein n=1 Tax=Dryococelus australis TaxID=614101 RepID=A0ABQ9GKR6_9NEOP|nr:hypothetical protein PR048_026210 [Dryococelus australis]